MLSQFKYVGIISNKQFMIICMIIMTFGTSVFVFTSVCRTAICCKVISNYAIHFSQFNFFSPNDSEEIGQTALWRKSIGCLGACYSWKLSPPSSKIMNLFRIRRARVTCIAFFSCLYSRSRRYGMWHPLSLWCR